MVSFFTSQYTDPTIPTSRAIHSPTKSPGRLPIYHNDILIILMKNLSANGSKYVPKTVAVDGNLRAMYPSRKSVNPIVRKSINAISGVDN